MNLTQYKALFIVAIAIMALLVISPALQRVLVYPRSDYFTEISLLGPEHRAENYPYNITNGKTYSIFLGVANQLGSCAYYQIQVKFRNETQSAPDSFNHTSSSLPSLYNFTAIVADKESLEIPIVFAFNYSSTMLQTKFESMKINNVTLNMQNCASDWDPSTKVFYGNLFFEFWIYNSTAGSFQYHERYLDLKFNMSSTGVV